MQRARVRNRSRSSSRHKDLRTFVGRIVEDELWTWLDDVGRVEIVTPVEEEEVFVACTLDALEELLRNDLVRVDVRQR